MNDRPETVRFCWKRLPHWEIADGRYFVTIRLHGAIPPKGMERIQLLREKMDIAVANGQDAVREQRMVFREMEMHLHQATAVAHLQDPRVAGMVVEAIRHRERDGTWTMLSYVVMPNHVHLFFCLGDRSRPCAPTRGQLGRNTNGVVASGFPDGAGDLPGIAGAQQTTEAIHGYTLKSVLEPFKHWTAHEAKRILELPICQFWQREWFDHWSRSAAEDEGIARYVRNNPVRAGLVADYRDWPWGSWNRSMEKTSGSG